MNGNRRSMKHKRSTKSKRSLKQKQKRAMKQKRSMKNKRAMKARRSAKHSSRKYYGLLPGTENYVKLDENVVRARNIGWSNWSGSAAEENAMRKELNDKYLTPLVNNKTDDEAIMIARQLAHLEALRKQAKGKKNEKAVEDDTDDIEDDIYYAFTSAVYKKFKNPPPELLNDKEVVKQLDKTDYKGNVKGFIDKKLGESDASSFFSTNKPRGSGTRLTEDAKRGVVEGAKAAGSAIVEHAKAAGSAIAEHATAAGNAIVAGVQAAGSAIAEHAKAAGSAIVAGAQALGSALGDGCPSGSSIDYDYTLLNPIAQKEKNCYENCDLMEVNDGLYCLPSKMSRFDSNFGSGKSNPDPKKYKLKDPFTDEPRRLRKLKLKRQDE